MFGKLLKGGMKAIKGGAKAMNSVSKMPIVGNVLRAVPGVGTAMSVASLGMAGYNVAKSFTGGSGGGAGLPALPSGMPALPGTANAPAIVGDRSLFRDDPNIAEALKAWAISAHNLRTAYRSPIKGYVVVRDVNGDPYALPKQLARQYAGWRPSKKPPISVGDWQAVQRADRVVKKVRKVMTKMTRVDAAVSGGKVKVKGRKKS